MKKLVMILSIVALSTYAFALDMSQMKPVSPQKSARQLELERKYAELKPTMPGKTPYEVCTAAVAKLPPLKIPKSHPDYARQEASCNAYEGSPALKAAGERKAAEKASDKSKEGATTVVKPK